MNESKVEIRIQFSQIENDILNRKTSPDELIIRIQPKEAIYLKISSKSSGAASNFEAQSMNLYLDYKNYNNKVIGVFQTITNLIIQFNSYLF
jgi:glucose-6-phosphate 1-dehydrogenase